MRCPAFPVLAAILVALASDAPAAGEPSILARTLANERAAFAGVNNLTYQKTYSYKTLDPNGKLKYHQVELYDVIFLNSSEFERLTSVDGKPLSRGQRKKESERERQEELRRKAEPPALAKLQSSPDSGAIYQFMPRDEGRRSNRPLDPMIMPDLIPRLYLVTAKGEDMMGDRRVYVFTAIPNPALMVRGDPARSMANLSLEIRIDVEDLRFAEIKATVTGNQLSWSEGSTIDLRWGRLDELQPDGCGGPKQEKCDRVWVHAQTVASELMPVRGKFYRKEMEVLYHDRRRFGSDSGIVFDPVDTALQSEDKSSH
jgi:hypothetical protein